MVFKVKRLRLFIIFFRNHRRLFALADLGLEAGFRCDGFSDNNALVAVSDKLALSVCPVDNPAGCSVFLDSLNGAEDFLVVAAADFIEAVGCGHEGYVTGSCVCLKFFDTNAHRRVLIGYIFLCHNYIVYEFNIMLKVKLVRPET